MLLSAFYRLPYVWSGPIKCPALFSSQHKRQGLFLMSNYHVRYRWYYKSESFNLNLPLQRRRYCRRLQCFR